MLLKECHVAGAMHVDDIPCKTQTLGVGSPLVLKREPKVSQKELEDHWLDLRIGIYLKDSEHANERTVASVGRGSGVG